eukprot:8975987-Alexandrium_andersonii.AAC.1
MHMCPNSFRQASSATTVQKHSLASMRDGSSSSATRSMAAFGHWGTQPQNVQRDMSRAIAREGLDGNVKPFRVVTCVRLKNGK